MTSTRCNECNVEMDEPALISHLENVHVGLVDMPRILLSCKYCCFSVSLNEQNLLRFMKHAAITGHKGKKVIVGWDEFLGKETKRLKQLIHKGSKIINYPKKTSVENEEPAIPKPGQEVEFETLENIPQAAAEIKNDEEFLNSEYGFEDEASNFAKDINELTDYSQDEIMDDEDKDKSRCALNETLERTPKRHREEKCEEFPLRFAKRKKSESRDYSISASSNLVLAPKDIAEMRATRWAATHFVHTTDPEKLHSTSGLRMITLLNLQHDRDISYAKNLEPAERSILFPFDDPDTLRDLEVTHGELWEIIPESWKTRAEYLVSRKGGNSIPNPAIRFNSLACLQGSGAMKAVCGAFRPGVSSWRINTENRKNVTKMAIDVRCHSRGCEARGRWASIAGGTSSFKLSEMEQMAQEKPKEIAFRLRFEPCKYIKSNPGLPTINRYSQPVKTNSILHIHVREFEKYYEGTFSHVPFLGDVRLIRYFEQRKLVPLYQSQREKVVADWLKAGFGGPYQDNFFFNNDDEEKHSNIY